MRPTIYESKIARAIWLIALAGGVALRLYMAAQPPIVTPDSTDRYESLAREILAGRSIVRFSAASYGPTRVNQPGYPYFLAAVYSVAGENRRAVVVAQAALEALTVLIILLLARRADLAPLSRAVVALIALLCPVLPLLARTIWAETLATAALAAAVLACLGAVRSGRAASWMLAGAGAAFCWLIRPDFVPTIVLLAASVLIICGRALPFRAALAAAAFAATIAPWVAENYIQLGKVAALGPYSVILERAYVRWLDTWVDDVSQLAPYWWYPKDPASPSYFPPDKVIDPEERALAEAALAQARAAGSFNTEPVRKTFDELAARARRERPLRTFVVVPLRRLASTWVNLAGYAKSSAARIIWILLLLAAVAGAVWGVRHRFDIALLLLATVIGRSVLPAAFAIGVEPRFVVEALPAVFIFLGFSFEAAYRAACARFHN